MVSLQGKHCYLRALEPDDLDFLYELENDTLFWEISNTVTPYSKGVLKRYLDNAHRDIYDVKQLRLCICSLAHQLLGFVDLFDFDPTNRRAGLGLVIKNQKDRNKGLGAEAITLCCDYGFTTLGLHQIYAGILEDNLQSIHVFEKLGFKNIGVKKDWVFTNGAFKNEVLYQKINQE